MVHGPDAVHDLIEASSLEYPVSVRRLERNHALENVHIDARGNSVMLAEVLSDVEAERFQDRADLTRKLEPAFEEHRQRRSGIITRLKRRFLP